MRRAILKLGDKTTAGGIVLEGMDTCMHHGTPMTFIGAKVWCPACDSEGVIGWKGPHQNATMMGKQQALEGDICLCNCDAISRGALELSFSRGTGHGKLMVQGRQPAIISICGMEAS
ncbi:PAAR domain-containing protein [Paraburkholderia sp. J7]|uniref:PAAR domain-containing protein n=1 Tax=Paraburkholderia sp. J7 TaxID=2805438 RepID=UPI002AB651DF|nr:PAAR domain-containing protein [Paraburkholderia sp. J7]